MLKIMLHNSHYRFSNGPSHDFSYLYRANPWSFVEKNETTRSLCHQSGQINKCCYKSSCNGCYRRSLGFTPQLLYASVVVATINRCLNARSCRKRGNNRQTDRLKNQVQYPPPPPPPPPPRQGLLGLAYV